MRDSLPDGALAGRQVMGNVASETKRRVTLSVVIPCFNEARTLAACLERVLSIRSPELDVEVIIVDDCSGDGSLDIGRDFAARHACVNVISHDRNRGKGAALRTGLGKATGDFVAIQDADLEYDPRDLCDLLGPLRDGRADVVFGSRFKGQGPHRVMYFWHYAGNALLTLLSNMFTDLNLTDMETCYKVFRRDVLHGVEIREDRFGFEPEIVAKVAHRGLRIYEMAISYEGRTYEEGKKITWRDGLRALYCVFRYNADHLPLPMQFAIYTVIGGTAAGSEPDVLLGALGERCVHCPRRRSWRLSWRPWRTTGCASRCYFATRRGGARPRRSSRTWQWSPLSEHWIWGLPRRSTSPGGLRGSRNRWRPSLGSPSISWAAASSSSERHRAASVVS